MQKNAFYEAFYIYDTMSDELIEKNEPAYMLVLIEIMIKIAEIAFIDGGKDAGVHRMSYALTQIEEAKSMLVNEDDMEVLTEKK